MVRLVPRRDCVAGRNALNGTALAPSSGNLEPRRGNVTRTALGLPADWDPLGAVAIGVPADAPHPRPDLDPAAFIRDL